MATVAITGITGLAGSCVGNALRHAGHTVIGISRRFDAQSIDYMLRVVPDLTDVSALAEALIGCDLVFHFADRADRRTYQARDVGAAAAVMVALRTAATRRGIDRIVAASSIYADRDDRPDNLYGRSKRAMEAVGIASEPGAPVMVLRLPPLYGPSVRGSIRHFARAAKKGWFLPFGLARAPRRFLSLNSLANLCLHLAEIDDTAFARAHGRIFVPIDARQGSFAALAHTLAGGRARLLPIPGIDRLLGGRVTSEQLERDRVGLLNTIGWEASD